MYIIFNKPDDILPDFHYAKIDDKVLVWNDDEIKIQGHFAGISYDNKPMIFSNGKTSWTATNSETEKYNQCRRIS